MPIKYERRSVHFSLVIEVPFYHKRISRDVAINTFDRNGCPSAVHLQQVEIIAKYLVEPLTLHGVFKYGSQSFEFQLQQRLVL